MSFNLAFCDLLCTVRFALRSLGFGKAKVMAAVDLAQLVLALTAHHEAAPVTWQHVASASGQSLNCFGGQYA
jgi:hypothetical protein